MNKLLSLFVLACIFLSACSLTQDMDDSQDDEEMLPQVNTGADQGDNGKRIIRLDPSKVLCGAKDISHWSQRLKYTQEWSIEPAMCNETYEQFNRKENSTKEYFVIYNGDKSSDYFRNYRPFLLIQYEIPSDISIASIVSATVDFEIVCSIHASFWDLSEFDELTKITDFKDQAGNKITNYDVCQEFRLTKHEVSVPINVYGHNPVLYIDPGQYNSITRVIPEVLTLEIA